MQTGTYDPSLLQLRNGGSTGAVRRRAGGLRARGVVEEV